MRKLHQGRPGAQGAAATVSVLAAAVAIVALAWVAPPSVSEGAQAPAAWMQRLAANL